jgi:NADH-quinone oxidoreductase subunit M
VVARERVAMLPLIILMVWMGTYTQTFLPPINTAGAAILEKTTVNQEFHARNVLPQELIRAR